MKSYGVQEVLHSKWICCF